VAKLCKENNIDYVEAVTGFEGKTFGKSHPVKNGIIAF